ncbi:class I SAM-dependent methyltransferase [Aquimarina sediminis]|uniref:class I SAM-dependent methyltransferase n=1 Tax=Aquimarina sediminis TaxID=2070536 RepID=UPI000CA05684|nr:class I SAM-dependent methyltransferase [Aquimarina sediminis]
MKERELKEIASQLSCPNGDSGLKMAERMNRTNLGMIINTINSLELKSNDHVLELGHGKANHLSEILRQVDNISYYGLEISESMKAESEKSNDSFIKKNQSKFELYDGSNIPFSDHSFDKIMTVNTIYFWDKPLTLLLEIYRVLKPKGQCLITFANKDFMQSLPFVDSRFELYDFDKIKGLGAKIPFSSIDGIYKNEEVESKTGDRVNREYTIIRFTK